MYHDQCLFHHLCLAPLWAKTWAQMGPLRAQPWAHHGPKHGPKMDPEWAQSGPRMVPKWVPKGTQMDQQLIQNGSPRGPKMRPKWAHMGPYGALMGPKVSVEQTLIADSPRPTFMTKTNEKVPYELAYWALNVSRLYRQPTA